MRVDGLAFSPDGTLLASGSADNTVKLWDIASRREVRTLAAHTGGVKAVAFRPDGQWLASGGIDGNIKFWEVATGNQLRNLPGNGSVTTLAFSADGRFFAAGSMAGSVKLWDLKSGHEALTLAGHKGSITSVAFSSDGHWLATGSIDRTVKIWNVETGSEQRTLMGHTDRIITLAFSPDGKLLATGSLDTKVKLWQVGAWNEQPFPLASTAKVLAVAFTPDSQRLISAYADKTIKVNEAPTGRELNTLTDTSDDPSEAISIAISSDGRWVAASPGDKTVELRDVATGRDVRTLTTHSYSVYATAFSAGGHWFATGGKENTVKLWEVATGRELYTLEPNGGFVNTVAFSPDERTLVCGSLSGKITLWDVATGQKLRDFPVVRGGVNSVAFSPDGAWLISGHSDHTIRRWNVADGTEVGKATGHTAEVNAVAISPNGALIISGGADKQIKIWDANIVGPEPRTLSGHTGEVLAVALSPDGQSIASGSTDKLVKIWNTRTGQLTNTLAGHEAEVKAVAFSKDGKLLATGGKDNVIKFWDSTTGQLVTTLLGHSGEVQSLTFSTDGRWLASGSDDGSTRIWDAKTGELAATLISLRESAAGVSLAQKDWLVVSPDGLFDGSPAAWNQILWRFDQNTTNIRPVEVFFNEFFAPGLLGDILADKRPRAPRDISQLDRRQPIVTLALADEQISGATPITKRDLTLKIQVAEAPPDKDHPAGSGAGDVRLFRNGSLVKVWRGDVLVKKGTATILETTIPIIAGVNELTVYAFNRNDIKSADARLIITGAESLKRPATAYLIAVGLNTYANTRFNLKYAAADANDFREEVRRNEEKLLDRFAEVVMVPLMNEEATKANILAALHRLGGSEEPLAAGAPAALAKLKAAQPEDAVVIFFAGHGIASRGSFYMLPHDLGYEGSRRVDEAGLLSLMSHGVSDRELEKELERVGAAQILFVIDACNSGQALEGDEKRRGPMNSKGLAQLAYEKGIYILAAAQSYQAALEADELGHGLLTYALIEEGLKKAAADQSPTDGRVFLREWFDYATSRVPQLQLQKMQQLRGIGKDVGFVEGDDKVDPVKRNLQRPRAFYRRDIPVPLIAISQQAAR